MRIEINCAELGSAWEDHGGIRLQMDNQSDVLLIGDEAEVMETLQMIAELYNATVQYRDPGPEARVIPWKEYING